jgi:hypothetical protein
VIPPIPPIEQEDKPTIEAVQLSRGHDCDLLAMDPKPLPSDSGGRSNIQDAPTQVLLSSLRRPLSGLLT